MATHTRRTAVLRRPSLTSRPAAVIDGAAAPSFTCLPDLVHVSAGWMWSPTRTRPCFRSLSPKPLHSLLRFNADPVLRHPASSLPLLVSRRVAHLHRLSPLPPSSACGFVVSRPLCLVPTSARQSSQLYHAMTTQHRRPLSTAPPSSSSLPPPSSSQPPSASPVVTAAMPSSTSASPLPSSASSADAAASPSSFSSAWSYWTSEPVSHPRYSPLWWRDTVLVLVVFSITGSLSLYIVRPLLTSVLGLQGSMREGPWSYRILTLLLVPPAYSLMLLTIGTAVGRHVYFKRIALRMWGRLLPKSWLSGKQQPSPLTRTREMPTKAQ